LAALPKYQNIHGKTLWAFIKHKKPKALSSFLVFFLPKLPLFSTKTFFMSPDSVLFIPKLGTSKLHYEIDCLLSHALSWNSYNWNTITTTTTIIIIIWLVSSPFFPLFFLFRKKNIDG
jgi:hypothetical protein